MGNVLQCSSQDDQLKAAENALENVKEEAHQYKQRIAELEAQMYKVRVAQLEKALKKERDAKTPNGKSRDENDGFGAVDGTESKIGGILSEIDAINQKVNVVTSSSSMNRPSTEQPKSDNYGTYAKAEGGAVFRSIMLEAKPPSFGKIYGAESPEAENVVSGFNPLYNNPLLKEQQPSTESSGINIKIPPMPSLVIKKQSSNGNILVGSPMRMPVSILSPSTGSKGLMSETRSSLQPTEDEEWMRLAISKARIDEEDREARERPMTLQQQDSLAGLALPAVTFKKTNNGPEVVESAGV